MSGEVKTEQVPAGDGNFGVARDTNLTGGWRVVADTTERDAIPTGRRTEGMRVRTLNDGKEWILDAGLTTWTEAGGGPTPPSPPSEIIVGPAVNATSNTLPIKMGIVIGAGVDVPDGAVKFRPRIVSSPCAGQAFVSAPGGYSIGLGGQYPVDADGYCSLVGGDGPVSAIISVACMHDFNIDSNASLFAGDIVFEVEYDFI